MAERLTHMPLCVMLLVASCLGCIRQIPPIEPHFDETAETFPKIDFYPFAPLTEGELKGDWAKEQFLGLSFAQEGDFYRAITCFKRAAILIPLDSSARRLELHHYIALCYYQAGKYVDVIYTFENSPLGSADGTFAAFTDLVVIICESYAQIGEKDKSEKVRAFIAKYAPELALDLEINQSIQTADLPNLKKLATRNQAAPVVGPLLQVYAEQSKSPQRAQILNAALPGAGYAYVGQKQAALTSFTLNSLFIAAAYHFFSHGHIAAGAITAGFELGWYMGGIRGAGLAAKEYNERLFEKQGARALRQEKIFPLFMLKFHF